MIKLRKQSYFDKYLNVINSKNGILKRHGYYIKIPAKYDIKFWLLAALKKHLFNGAEPKKYYTLSKEETTPAEIQNMKLRPNKGGILVFPNDFDITKRYAENFHDIFLNRTIKTIFQKYNNEILWCLGRRYQGVYKNKPRGKIFNASSITLEILGLNSVDLINISVKLAVQFQQPIVLIKDLNNEQMLILGKNIIHKKKESDTIDFGPGEEFTDWDITQLEAKLDDSYRLCEAWQYSRWEIHDIYPKLNDFWVKDGRWYGR